MSKQEKSLKESIKNINQAFDLIKIFENSNLSNNDIKELTKKANKLLLKINKDHSEYLDSKK